METMSSSSSSSSSYTLNPRRSSRVPHHLRRFHRASKSCSDLTTTTAPYPCSFAPPNPADPVELCPPHWRLREKQRSRTTLRAILLKDWQSLQSAPKTTRRRTPERRPTMMRIKESDDYITARAANPRTGLISPSVGSPSSPRGPLTPGSPGEALKLRDEAVLQSSPTLQLSARPTLRRANEGRKVSEAAGGSLRASNKWWVVSGVSDVASPPLTVGEERGNIQAKDDGDRFLVNMPSAREPQPYAFPGYSAQQIEAFEHYKQKARRVSSEGYDRRVLLAAAEGAESGANVGDGLSGLPGHGAPLPSRDVTVLKRRVGVHGGGLACETEMACTSGAAVDAANFAPFSSPKTPAMRSDNDARSTALKTIHASEKQQQRKVHKLIARKPVAGGAGLSGDLPNLPKVRLAHPNVAARPHQTQQRHTALVDTEVEARKCSFGCVKDSESGACVSSNAVTVSGLRVPLFHENTVTGAERERAIRETFDMEPPLHAIYWLTDLLVGALVALFDLSKHIHLPSVSLPVLDILRSENAPPHEKMQAMKMVVYSTGQALGLITAVVMVWNLGSVVVRVLEVLLWPLVVPLRVLRWVGGG